MATGIYPRKSLEERFWAKVIRAGPVPEFNPKIGPCWTWLGAIDGHGYGSIGSGSGGPTKTAHVVSFNLHVGPIPKGMTIDHLCRNRACPNPKHLEIVTRVENVLRGESPMARKAKQRTCIFGHHFTRLPNGRRQCMVCKSAHDKARVRHAS